MEIIYNNYKIYKKSVPGRKDDVCRWRIRFASSPNIDAAWSGLLAGWSGTCREFVAESRTSDRSRWSPFADIRPSRTHDPPRRRPPPPPTSWSRETVRCRRARRPGRWAGSPASWSRWNTDWRPSETSATSARRCSDRTRHDSDAQCSIHRSHICCIPNHHIHS